MRKPIKVKVITSAKANENFTNAIIEIYEKILEEGRLMPWEMNKSNKNKI